MQLGAPSKTLIATSIAHFVNDGSQYVFITLYPKLLPSNALMIGVLVALQNLFSVVLSPIVGRRADTSKRYSVFLSSGLILVAVAISGYAVSALLFSGFQLFLSLIPFSIIAGVGTCFYHPIGAAAIHDQWIGKSIGRAMGINGSLGSVGRAVYPLFVVALVVYLRIPSVSLLGGVAVASAVGILGILRGIKFSGGTQARNENGHTERPATSTVPISAVLPKVLNLTIIAFCRSILSFGIVNFIPIYITTVLGISYGFELGGIFSLMLAMAIVGQPIFGSLADRVGRRTTLGISIVGSSVAILLFLSTKNLLLATGLLAVYGLFVFTGFPLLMPLANAIVPEGAEVTSGSIVWGVGTVGGGAVGPILVGLLQEKALLGSLSASFEVLAAIALVSIAILPFVPKPSKTIQDKGI